MKKTIINGILLAGYLIYLLFLIKVTTNDQNKLFGIVGLLPLAILCGVKLITSNTERKLFYRVSGGVIAFFLCYYLFFGNNLGKLAGQFSNFITILLHIIVIYKFLIKESFQDIKYTVFGLLLVVIIVVFVPSYAIVGNLQLGSFYNLISPQLLTVSTVEAPLLVSMLLLFSFYDIAILKRYSIINIFSIVFSIWVLLLFNRRGFIFSSLLSVFFYYIFYRFNLGRLIYLILLPLFLPMYWESVSALLASMLQNESISNLVVRNNQKEIVNATGRSVGWKNILHLFYSFDSRYLFGYPGPQPGSLFLSEAQAGRFQHAHNTFLQLFLDSGYICVAIFLGLLIYLFNQYVKIEKENQKRFTHNFFFLLIIYICFLSATETFIRWLEFTNFIFCYAVIGFLAMNVQRKRIVSFQTLTVTEPRI